MRHKKSGRQLNRNSSHRKAMFKNMAISLFEHEHIETSLAKAKELRKTAEPLITLAKNDTLMRRRLAYSRLGNKKIRGCKFFLKRYTKFSYFYWQRPRVNLD